MLAFDSDFLDRRMRAHREWQRAETHRLSREVVTEICIAVREHLHVAASEMNLNFGSADASGNGQTNAGTQRG